MFYADVPQHRWLMFGSHLTGSADRHSDFDVILSGPSRKDLDHPYFEDLLGKLRAVSVENDGVLDLFLDEPERKRLDSVFSPGERALDAGPAYYEAVTGGAKEITIQHFVSAVRHLSARGRDPITSREQFEERMAAKAALWRGDEPRAALPLPADDFAGTSGTGGLAR